MSTNFEWGEAEDSFEALDEQEAWGDSEASYDQGSYGEAEAEAEAVLDEMEEAELASDLLSLGSEAELNQAVGKLMHSAARAVGGSISRDVGQALGSAIKAAAQDTLAAAGAPGAASAGEVLGLETEGLSGEDQEFEVMRRLVRFAGAAAGRAARAGRGINPRAIVRSSLVSAARRWAPGFLRRFGMPHRRDAWRRRPWRRHDWRRRHQPWGAQPYPYPYPQPYPQPYQPGLTPPGMPPQQPQFDPNAGGFGAPHGQPAPGMQGMPDSGAPMDAGGGGASFPMTGRWTRQGGQLTIHL
jgi:hypothetical protein